MLSLTKYFELLFYMDIDMELEDLDQANYD